MKSNNLFNCLDQQSMFLTNGETEEQGDDSFSNEDASDDTLSHIFYF